MKRLFTSLAVVLMTLTFASATETKATTPIKDLDVNSRYRNAEPILFVERGIEFMIFPDGTFDFNTEFGNTTTGDMYYRRSNTRRGTINTTHGAPGTRVQFTQSRIRPRGGVVITHDYLGRVRRIGNVYVNYTRSGKVKRIGTVYMQYNRGRGLLKQVGGLHVQYNAWGEIVFTRGVVNRHNANCNTNGFSFSNTGWDLDWNDDWDDDWDDDWNDDWGDDNDMYYYKKGKKQSKKKAKTKR